jgi:hypothetical protein
MSTSRKHDHAREGLLAGDLTLERSTVEDLSETEAEAVEGGLVQLRDNRPGKQANITGKCGLVNIPPQKTQVWDATFFCPKL